MFRWVHYNGPILKQGSVTVSTELELYQDRTGEYRFRLKTGNEESNMKPETHKDKFRTMNRMESVKRVIQKVLVTNYKH